MSARASNAASPGERVASAAVFLALVGLAGGLRFWGIHQSLPLVTGRPDEREILQYTAGFPAGDLNPRWFIYPNLYFYVVFAWERLVLAVRGLWLTTSDYGLTLRTALASLILYGRWLSALAGTLTVPAVWAIGRRLGAEGLGLAAAALLATDFLHVRDSHTLKPDTLLALGLLISVWLVARWGSTVRASQSTPWSRRVSATNRPKTSPPTRPQIVDRTPSLARSSAAFEAQPPIEREEPAPRLLRRPRGRLALQPPPVPLKHSAVGCTAVTGASRGTGLVLLPSGTTTGSIALPRCTSLQRGI